MSDLPTPAASRLRAPSWRDTRLMVGLLLVLVSTVLGSVVVARADDRVPVWAAKAQVSRASDSPTTTSCGSTSCSATAPRTTCRPTALSGPTPGRCETCAPASWFPVDRVGGADAVTVQQVALLVDATSASVLTAGSVVDVYVNRPKEASTVGLPAYVGPERVLERVAVVRVAADDGVLAGSAVSRAVHVMVPREEVQAIVADVDLGARITLVPVPGGVAAAGS